MNLKILIVSIVAITLLTVAHSLRVAVFGASGKTGIATAKNLLKSDRVDSLLCVSRNIGRIRREIGPDGPRLNVLPCDITRDSEEKLRKLVSRCDCVVSTMGARGGFDDGPKEVDFEGTKRLITACQKENVQRFVLVSSLLTNGMVSGQILNPQYILLNCFRGILIWKREAEKFLEKSGLDYFVVRPGGLTDDEIKGSAILYGSADSFSGGRICRKKVAEVVTACCFADSNNSNRICEIVQSEDAHSLLSEEGILLC
jgi:hypothetical protein